jgi:protein import protein ZIM17
LGIFGDRKMTVEEILRERGELIRKGTLGPDGDIEFWADEQGKDTGAEHGDGVAEGKSGGA